MAQFAEEIKSNGFAAAQLELDDDWTPAYGDMTFDARKFPDPRATVATLRDMGFRVTAWVRPPPAGATPDASCVAPLQESMGATSQ